MSHGTIGDRCGAMADTTSRVDLEKTQGRPGTRRLYLGRGTRLDRMEMDDFAMGKW